MRAASVFKQGIERRAQPLERLKKTYAEFQSRNAGSFETFFRSTTTTVTLKAIEVRGYDAQMIHDSDYSFEEIRAQHWYAKPKISKPILKDRSIIPSAISEFGSPMQISGSRQMPSANTIENAFVDDDDEDEQLPALGVAVNPDDLTHINVFKDNTADLREIAKLVKSGKAAEASNPPPAPKEKQSTTDWLLKEIIKHSPLAKTAAKNSANKRTFIDISSSPIKTAESENNCSQSNAFKPADYKIADITLSLPKELEDDSVPTTTATTSVPDFSALLDPFDLEFRIAQAEAVLTQIAPAIPNLNLRLDESAAVKVKAFEKSLGRDGSGPNHTVSSLQIASGHYFMERKLGEGGYGKVYLGVDLQKDIDNEDASETVESNQVAVKIETLASVWEAYILFRLAAFLGPNQAQFSRHFPRLLSCSVYSDVSFVVMDYYEQGSLLAALNCYRQQNVTIDEAIVLFYAAELLKTVGILHRASILHTDIKLENVLLYSTKKSSNWSSTFQRDGSEGWGDRGLVLIDYGRAVDLKLLKEEENSRFLIKSKHASFNGCPLIAGGLPVGHEMDWYGVADCLHWLLFQKALSPESHTRPLQFKRYWQVDLWEPLFADLFNPPPRMNDALDCMKKHLEAIWTRLESWKRTPSLKSLLTRQEIMLYERK